MSFPTPPTRVNSARGNGADDGTRTRDPHLGKVMLYQLSHVRATTNSITAALDRLALLSVPRVAKATRPAFGGTQLGPCDEIGLHEARYDQLCHAVPHREVDPTFTQIDENNLDLTTITRVYETRGIQHRHTIMECESTPRHHQSHGLGSQLERQSSRSNPS